MQDNKMNEMVDLVNKLNKWNFEYYVLNAPTISDYEFDMEMKKLQELERQTGTILEDSPTQRVGSDLQEGFKDVVREKIMGSIENCYDLDELKKWLGGFNGNETFLLEPKYDGTSCSIIYENGILKEASTRGNGYKGSDITENVKTIKTIPLVLNVNDTPVTNDWHYNDLYIPERIEIRGEILLPKSELARINKERLAAGQEPFANCRNAAAGSIKQLDTRVTASRNLQFRPYGVICDDKKFTDKYLKYQHCMLDVAEIFGFLPGNYWRSADAYTTVMLVQEFENRFLNEQDYCMDGCVVKVESLESQMRYGYTQKVPKWAKAFKFKQEQQSTKLLDVEISLGMSGQLGFVANLQPVEIDGSTVSRATLNNMDFIENMGLEIGQYVFVEKGGAVIPNIVGIDVERNLRESVQSTPISKPEVCPFCGHPLSKRLEEGAHLYCTNNECPERQIQKINHFVSKDCMNIDGVSIMTIRQIYSHGILRDWMDMYKWYIDDLMNCGFTEKTAGAIINQIMKSRENSQAQVLRSLGIQSIGKVSAEKVIDAFTTIKDLFTASVSEIQDRSCLGLVAANNLYEYLHNEDNKSEIDMIIDTFTNVAEKPAPTGNSLAGMTILATGTLENFKRDEIKDSVIANGGKYASGVTGKLSFLLVGADPGASKIEKAEKLGIKMITESEYLNMIGK